MDWLTIFTASVVFLFALYYSLQRSKSKQLPPGPPGLPILGNLLSFGGKPEAAILKWKEQYGDIFTVYDGRKPMVVLSNFTTMRKAYGDNATAGRDLWSKTRIDDATHLGLGLLFSEGDVWKVHRRFALSTLRDLGMGKNWMEDTIISQVKDLLEILRNTDQKPFNPKVPLTNSIANVICALIFGRRFLLTDPKFTRLTTAISEELDSFAVDSLACALPFLLWFPNPIQKRIARSRVNVLRQDAFFKELIDDHAANVNKQEDVQDYLYAYQAEQQKGGFNSLSGKDLSETQLLASLSDLFGAGTETTSTTTLWTLVFLLENPDVMAKVHAEIDDNVGREKMLTNDDRPFLPYTEAVVLEVQRCGNLVPLTLHKTTESVTIDGYVIPSNTMVLGNLYSIHRDPRWFKNPEKFDPLRFLDENRKLTKPEGFAPFGVGKRACLGEALAKMELFLFIANLLRSFTISLPPGKSISHEDYASSVVIAPLPFELIFIPRI